MSKPSDSSAFTARPQEFPDQRVGTAADRSEKSVTVNHGKQQRRSGVYPTLGQAISDALARLQAELGGKCLAEYFDGREGEAVAKSTVSRWIGEPRRFPAVFLPTLLELDPVFRDQVVGILFARWAAPREFLQFLAERDPQAAAVAAAAQEEMLRRILHGPGGRGETYG